jgi:hypothetical protein
MFYRLPRFVSETLASQPSPPRNVTLTSVAGAVLAGVDCAIYFVVGVFLVAMGWRALSLNVPLIAPALFAGGVALLLLVAYRIWAVKRALEAGAAQLAEVTQTEAGTARLWGTPWGDLTGSRYSAPVAARGTYRLMNTGETGRYYMQQSWALALVPGDTFWILRLEGRDVLYAPTSLKRHKDAI